MFSSREFDDNFNRALTISGTGIVDLGNKKVRGEIQLRVTSRDFGASNIIVVRGKLLNETDSEWTTLETVTGNDTAVIDISTYDQVQVECTTYDSTPGRFLMSGFFFKLNSSTPVSATYVGTLYKITSDLTISSWYEYRVRQLILEDADIIIDGGDLIITG